MCMYLWVKQARLHDVDGFRLDALLSALLLCPSQRETPAGVAGRRYPLRSFLGWFSGGRSPTMTPLSSREMRHRGRP